MESDGIEETARNQVEGKVDRSTNQEPSWTWKRKYVIILHIKETVSAALWDENNCVIELDHDSVVDYCKNKPIENYREMQMIFGNSLASDKFAKGSNEPLGTDVTQIEEDEEGNDGDVAAATQPTNARDSSATKPTKKAKSSVVEEDGLIVTLGRIGDKLADAIIAAGANSAPPPPPSPADEIPKNLYEILQCLEGFNAYLVENPRSARAFMKLPYIGQLTWLARYVVEEDGLIVTLGRIGDKLADAIMVRRLVCCYIHHEVLERTMSFTATL